MDTALHNSELHRAWGSRRTESMRSAMAVAVGRVGCDDVAGAGDRALARPMLRRLICPFCGGMTADTGRCACCQARFDPLSRQASQNEMGPWFVRDDSMPFRPGCNYSTIKRLVETRGIQSNSVIRGPSTRQFWMLAKHTPGVAPLLGVCHSCGGKVDPDAFACTHCQEPFSADRDRQHLGLGASRPLPGKARVEVLALRAEPPAGAELVSGPAAIPLVPQEGRGGNSHGRRSVDREGESSGEDGLDVIKRVDELQRNVHMLRRAWMSERKRSWYSVAMAGAVTLLAVVIISMT